MVLQLRLLLIFFLLKTHFLVEKELRSLRTTLALFEHFFDKNKRKMITPKTPKNVKNSKLFTLAILKTLIDSKTFSK